MHIEYQITEDDFVSAGQLAVQTKSKSAATQRYFLVGFGVLLSMYGVFTAIAKHTLSALWPGLIWGSILLGIGALYGFYGYHFRRMYRKVPLLRARRNLDIDDHNIQFKTATSESRTPWDVYIKFAENKDTFILFQQGNQIFIPIPKRELSTSQIDELRTLLAAHLPRK
jgi:hypothetical protein